MTILFFVQPTLGIADAIEPTINQTKSKQNLSFQTLYCSVDFIQSCSCALCIIFAHISFGVLSAILNQNEQQRKGSEKYPNRTRSFSCRSIFQGFSFSASHSHSHTHSTKHKTHKSFTLHWIIPIEYCCCCIFASNPNNELKKKFPGRMSEAEECMFAVGFVSLLLKKCWEHDKLCAFNVSFKRL